jgi:hypothetical protein
LEVNLDNNFYHHPIDRFKVDEEGNVLELSREEESLVNKENNDSAIGINASFASISTPTIGLSPTSSSTSSSTSSPDSGASSGSPKSGHNVEVLENLLQQTSISPSQSNTSPVFHLQKN